MASFLSDARTRIQHTNKLSLAPKDIKNLADIIATEKNVVSSSSKLSVDYRKAADALKEWGLNEGDDLADILPKLSILLGHLADAQSRFSDHDGTYRIHFKSIRMREESLTALKKSKETVQAKIATLEKKITKMSSENKDLPGLTTRLQESRSELVSLENSVSLEEARLFDFKRETVREGLGLRLGAMLELAEKMTIICEFGKMLAVEVPIERTSPGASRTPYSSANKTQAVVDEAQRCLTQVVFNPTPSIGNLNLDAPPASQSPSSDRDPVTPHQPTYAIDTSHNLPMDLPPLYFGDGPLMDKSNTVGGPNYGAGADDRPPASHNHTSLPYYGQRSENSSHATTAPLATHTTDAATSPPFPTPQSSAALSHEYVENVFHIAGSDVVPLATNPGKAVQPTASRGSSPSTPISLSHQVEASRNSSSHPQSSYNSSPRDYPSSLPSVASQSPLSPGPLRQEITATVTKDKIAYSPRLRENSSSSIALGISSGEGRTTNAGAFRRAASNLNNQTPPTSSARSTASSTGLIAADEALSTGAHTTVQPLQINKRDTYTGDHRHS